MKTSAHFEVAFLVLDLRMWEAENVGSLHTTNQFVVDGKP
jgi:hypothetical protein